MRDLAWLLLSANLLGTAGFPAALADLEASGDSFDAIRGRLLALDAEPAPLVHFLSQGERNRLGRYAERLLHFFLADAPSIDLLAAGLQVRDARRGGMTLGECDFLLRRVLDNRLLHWELAVKLYLFVPPEDDAVRLDERAAQFHWLGPNLADSLADKVERLLGHQLRMTTLEAARSTLPLPGPWLPQVYLKGWLFHPLAGAAQMPAIVSDDHGAGWWATLDEWWAHAHAAHNGDTVPAWSMLARGRWLAPARVPDAAAQSLVRMRETIETHWRERGTAEPLLIVALRLSGERDATGAPIWLEAARGFVVSEDWASRARRRIEELTGRADAAMRRAQDAAAGTSP